MKQLHIKTYYKVLFATGNVFAGLLDGQGVVTFGSSGCPIPISCTVRNLSVLCTNPAHTAITVTIQKNGVNQSLAATVGSGVTTVSKDTTNSISYAAGDLIRAHISGVSYFLADAPNLAVTIEMEATENIYSMAASGGGVNIGQGWIGGILGNGKFASFGGGYAASNTYSLAALAGNITRLYAYAHSGAPGAGNWTSYIVKNGIRQDGTGGTVDTSCVIMGSNTTAVSSFTLPIAIQDVLDVVTLRGGTNSGGAEFHVSNSITFDPTIAERFMFCGGNNDAISSGDFKWVDSGQHVSPEQYNSGIIGVNGVDVHGLYIQKSAPSGGKSTVNTLRRTLTDTGLAVTLTDLQTSGSDTSPTETYAEDSLIDIKCFSADGGNNNGLHWGIPVSVVGTDTIIVQKITNPVGSPEVFDFTAGGGLSPSTFSLQDGGVEVFSGLSPGTYSIVETAKDGWSTSISVSNGDDAGAITLGSGETVTVTVTNIEIPNIGSGIYKVTPGKRNDTLFSNASQEQTVDVKIPDPFIKSAYLGE